MLVRPIIFWKPEQRSWLINQKIILSYFRSFSTLDENLQPYVSQISSTTFYTIFKFINLFLLIPLNYDRHIGVSFRRGFIFWMLKLFSKYVKLEFGRISVTIRNKKHEGFIQSCRLTKRY